MTGMGAAELMLTGEIGILRTVPAPDPERLERLRRTAKALDVPFPKDLSYPDFIRTLRPEEPQHAAVLAEAAGVLRGSGYVAFAGDAPKDPVHAALASTYAHTTAPLRRLVDRYVGEACVALSAGEELPDWVRAELPKLPEVMQESAGRSSQYESGIVSTVEAALLEDSVGDTFDAVVVDLSEHRGGGTVAARRAARHGPLRGRRASARRARRGAARARRRDEAPGALPARLSRRRGVRLQSDTWLYLVELRPDPQ